MTPTATPVEAIPIAYREGACQKERTMTDETLPQPHVRHDCATWLDQLVQLSQQQNEARIRRDRALHLHEEAALAVLRLRLQGKEPPADVLSAFYCGAATYRLEEVRLQHLGGEHGDLLDRVYAALGCQLAMSGLGEEAPP